MRIVPRHARARARWRTHSRARSAAPHLAALPEHGRLRQVVLLGLSRTLRLCGAPGCSSPCVGTVPPAAAGANTGRLAHALVASDIQEQPGPMLQAEGGQRAPAACEQPGAAAQAARSAGPGPSDPWGARGAPQARGTAARKSRKAYCTRSWRSSAPWNMAPGELMTWAPDGRAVGVPGLAAAQRARRAPAWTRSSRRCDAAGRGTGRPPAPAAHRPAPPGAAGPPRPATAGRRASRPPPLAAGAARVTRRCCAVAALPGDSAYARTSEDHGQALCLDVCKALCARSASADSGHALQALSALRAGGARLCRPASDQSPAARHVAPSS